MGGAAEEDVFAATRMPAHAELTPSLQRLLREASYGQLATLMPDGSPHLWQPPRGATP
jgi:hypothetical protein